ncbi:hypothetical protein KYK31_02825 [Hymenobacter norwichensis]|uniref:hypothetical protein n=1 Tax=Hymenobacter telluris TaxID=2816474 RepID=UPI001A8D5E6A|nr:hypothetical protein [Hymenobacter telluris]MBW3372892.1 hypothetical protein [Hymenobacter norwichensis]
MQTTLTKLRFLVSLVLLLSSTACHKERPEPEAVPLPAELKSYTLFQPGTHWIYQDSATRQLDSVWVVSAEQTVHRLGNGSKNKTYPTLKYEDFRLRTRSGRGGPDRLYSIDRTCTLPNREDQASQLPCWSVRRSQDLPNSTADEEGTDVFPYLIDRDKASFLNIYNAVLYYYWNSQVQRIGGVPYDELLQVKLTADASENGWPVHYYWVSGKGIVRQRIRRNNVVQTWTLVRSTIVQ